MTKEEKRFLERFSLGELDGVVGNCLTTQGGSTVWTVIKDGIPRRIKQGPGHRFFNGKENEYISGAEHVLETWETPSEKIEFLRKFGWLMADTDARAYSAKFKPE